jgi:hypothetical protein
MTVQRVSDLNLDELQGREFFRSPAAWEDEVLYFLMLDRFSNGTEHGYVDNAGNVVDHGTTRLFEPGDVGNAVRGQDDRQRWETAGGGWEAPCAASPPRWAISPDSE